MKLKSIGVVTALVLIMFMSAIETSIVSLALPTIRNDLNVKDSISLIFAIYFIAIVIANPIVGELLDRIRIIYITISGISLFLVGSLLSGLSPDFGFLVISRFIQGLGAGVMMALGQIVPKLAFEIPLRYKIMGVVGSVWGISSIIGPLLGGAILEFATWHWLFFVNIPIALVAIILVFITFHFDNEANNSHHKLDVKGLSIFYVFIFFLLIALMGHGPAYLTIISIALAIITVVILVKAESNVARPFIPVKEFNSMIGLVFVTDFLYAIMLMGYNIYMPIYLQDKLGLTPLQSGFVVFPISLAWLTLNFTLDKIEAKLTRKGLYLAAFTALFICGVCIYVGVHLPLFIAVSFLLAGASFGTIYTKDSVITQEETDPNNMKRMMSLYTLTKSLGNSIGSTVMGAIYALSIPFIYLSIQNIIIATLIILLALMIIWAFFFRKSNIFRS
ncbi:multidrug efflux MFS transporter SdrM [Staphylococcus sp. SQ8-PEA]|uniref:Multidrug efflux MFS transporter SdrM n=1 Tax=Staphylococcus marylandisciuri TaxID=2981529 RepID=A0ABT2QM92_9STAP|nr:multidrug efflux MFS transporter SdrM [Staphylococcus marylandisciuri]MCU5745103.1 multidrug efflux MFS transporter SdrM [Staphylococcus marylandisciuri]